EVDEERIARAAYYHVRDFFLDPSRFSPWMSARGTDFMAHWWNVMPQYDGLWDNQGRVRPAYYAFRLLSLIKGQKLAVSGTSADVKAFAARNGSWNHVVFWNFPSSGPGEAVEAVVRFPKGQRGQFRFIKLDASAPVNNLAVIRQGSAGELEAQPVRTKLEPYDVDWVEIGQYHLAQPGFQCAVLNASLQCGRQDGNSSAPHPALSPWGGERVAEGQRGEFGTSRLYGHFCTRPRD